MLHSLQGRDGEDISCSVLVQGSRGGLGFNGFWGFAGQVQRPWLLGSLLLVIPQHSKEGAGVDSYVYLRGSSTIETCLCTTSRVEE